MSRPADNGSPAPELELPANFPGLGDDAATGGPYVDHTELRRVVGRLRTKLDSLRGNAPASMSATYSGPGTIGEVAGMGNVGPQETGQWEVASSFGANTEQAYTVLDPSYGKLLDHVEQWVDAVEKAIANYERFHQDSSA
ncbi:unnamed protein product [[Actinomadura] parvosata subsp. kistnae]|uniref:Uncharacterized protein n=2 Tax=Nonomuraea TaxID=83681 RepID=A0A1V0A941_9ACTN|nr:MULTISPECIES: hypothetical protein [unclassified Nonomuraea]AQZ66689.1 hypothetical protein BKM31_39285 [Nonomuraea sp. ATCC 55076]NJP98237.1 hypothetical protein [Nonomuraea sp. FMUSA5-5]SPL95200.1 unnamed protein product [Actinomadura parvosata subsp. kistnae]